MKIAALISDGVYLIEATRQEIGQIMGEGYVSYDAKFKTGQQIPVSALWKIISATRERSKLLQDGANVLRAVASSIDFATATLDPPPAAEPAKENPI